MTADKGDLEKLGALDDVSAERKLREVESAGQHSKTPITDGLMADPAIDKHVIPVRVFREMAKIEASRNELLAALKQLVECEGREGHAEYSVAMDDARAAISKASAS